MLSHTFVRNGVLITHSCRCSRSILFWQCTLVLGVCSSFWWCNTIRKLGHISKSAVLIKVRDSGVDCNSARRSLDGGGYRTLAEIYFSVQSGEQNSLRVLGAAEENF